MIKFLLTHDLKSREFPIDSTFLITFGLTQKTLCLWTLYSQLITNWTQQSDIQFYNHNYKIECCNFPHHDYRFFVRTCFENREMRLFSQNVNNFYEQFQPFDFFHAAIIKIENWISLRDILQRKRKYCQNGCKNAYQLIQEVRKRLFISGGSRISQRGRQPQRGRQNTIWPISPENCMKMKKFWARRDNILLFTSKCNGLFMSFAFCNKYFPRWNCEAVFALLSPWSAITR